MNYEHYTEVNLFDICDDVFHENETYRNDVWSKECMNRILQLGSGISGGKERIYSFFTQYDFSLADRAKFLKNEYGIGGRSYDFKNQNQDHGFIDHDSKGLTVCVSSKDSSSLFKDAESKTFSCIVSSALTFAINIISSLVKQSVIHILFSFISRSCERFFILWCPI